MINLQAIARRIKFCQWCGGPTKHEIPDGEEKIRAICTICEKIAYENPKMVELCSQSSTTWIDWYFELTMELLNNVKNLNLQVVGCLVEHDNKILLCKRNIEPSNGLWLVFGSTNLIMYTDISSFVKMTP